MMQGYRNFAGRYDVLPRAQRKALWRRVYGGQVVSLTLDEARQVLVWHQLWRRGQMGIAQFAAHLIGQALDVALGAGGMATDTGREGTRWRFAEMPARGTRFVALREDGRGADVFFRTPLGAVMDAESGERLPAWATDAALVSWFGDAGFAFWLPLPDGMQLFYEVQS